MPTDVSKYIFSVSTAWMKSMMLFHQSNNYYCPVNMNNQEDGLYYIPNIHTVNIERIESHAQKQACSLMYNRH